MFSEVKPLHLSIPPSITHTNTGICVCEIIHTPRVQFANIRKMVLCQGLPHCLRLCVDPCMDPGTSCPKTQLKSQVYMLDSKILKLFRLRGNRWKRAKCDQFFCPTYDLFDFCNPCFFYHTFTNDVDFVDKARQDHISNHRGRHLLPKSWGLILKFTLPKFQR